MDERRGIPNCFAYLPEQAELLPPQLRDELDKNQADSRNGKRVVTQSLQPACNLKGRQARVLMGPKLHG